MHYKNIIVHVETSALEDRRIELAARMALHEQARLVLLAAGGAGSPAAALLDEAVRAARATGPVDVEARLVEGDDAAALQEHSTCADLIVLGRADGQRVDFIEYVALNAACPVLVVPDAGRIFSLGDRVLIGWNGSAAAGRAVRAAMPFLRQANQVCVAVLEGTPVPPSGMPAEALVDYLATHKVKAECVRRRAGAPGSSLLEMAADLTSDLVVMGCAAHMRASAAQPGGATRATLETASLPLLMSH